MSAVWIAYAAGGFPAFCFLLGVGIRAARGERILP